MRSARKPNEVRAKINVTANMVLLLIMVCSVGNVAHSILRFAVWAAATRAMPTKRRQGKDVKSQPNTHKISFTIFFYDYVIM